MRGSCVLVLVVVLATLCGRSTGLGNCPVVSCNGAPTTGSTDGLAHQYGPVAGDAVFAFTNTLPPPSLTTFDTCGSDFDTMVFVLDAATMSEVASCDDCGKCGNRAQLSVEDLAVGDYVVVVGGHSSKEGAFEFAITCENTTMVPAPPASLECLIEPTPTPVANRDCSEVSQQALLDAMTGEGSGYDKLVRPNHAINIGLTSSEAPPDNVTTQFFITGIDDVSLVGGDILVYTYTRTAWYDERLKFPDKANGGCYDELHVPESEFDRFWIPDTYVENMVDSLTVLASGMYLYPNGYVYHSLKTATRITCEFDLHHFPLDTQRCYFEVSTYTNSRNEIWLNFIGGVAVEVSGSFDNTEYELKAPSTEPDSVETEYFLGGTLPWQFLFHRFDLVRKPTFYLKYVGASVMSALISYMSFFINSAAAPARVTSALLPILFNITMLIGLQTSLPRLTYWTWLERVLFGTLVFCGVTAAEYSVVSFFLKKENEVKAQKAKRKQEIQQNALVERAADLLADALGKKKKDKEEKKKEKEEKKKEKEKKKRDKERGSAGSDSLAEDKPVVQAFDLEMPQPTNAGSITSGRLGNARAFVQERFFDQKRSEQLDMVCRVGFLAAYFVFLTVLAMKGRTYGR